MEMINVAKIPATRCAVRFILILRLCHNSVRCVPGRLRPGALVEHARTVLDEAFGKGVRHADAQHFLGDRQRDEGKHHETHEGQGTERGIEIGTQLALCDRAAEQLRQPAAGARGDFADEGVAERSRLRQHLAHDQACQPWLTRERGHNTGQHLTQRHVAARPGRLLGESLQPAQYRSEGILEHGAIKPVLVAEMVMDHGRVHARRGRDLAHRSGLEVAAREQLARRFEQGRADRLGMGLAARAPGAPARGRFVLRFGHGGWHGT